MSEMETTKALIHVIADCKTCGKHWDDYLTAPELAAAHAKNMRHHVIADFGYFVEFNALMNRPRD